MNLLDDCYVWIVWLGVGICMSLGWESVALYLGVVRMGALVVSIAESFSTDEIELRFG